MNDISNNNVTKNCKIIDGFKYYELNVKQDYYFINIINLPKENLIKFTLFLKRIDNLQKANIIKYENEFSLDYFLNQTEFLNELAIKDINDLIKFFHTYFTDYNNKEENLINYQNNNPNLVILKILLFHNKIQINIELYNNNANNLNNFNIEQQKLKSSNSCKNLEFNIKKILTKLTEKKSKKNPKPDKKEINENNNILLTDYHISLIQKRIPFFQNFSSKNYKLNLIYKSSSEISKNFHQKCDNKGPNLIIILTKENRMFISFNKKSFNAVKESDINKVSWREINVKDDDIFIIDLFSKKIMKNKINKNDTKNKGNTEFKFLQQYENYGPAYTVGGFSFKIFDFDKYLSIEFVNKNIDEDSYIKSNYNLEKNNFLHIQDYEVYSISNKD